MEQNILLLKCLSAKMLICHLPPPTDQSFTILLNKAALKKTNLSSVNNLCFYHFSQSSFVFSNRSIYE